MVSRLKLKPDEIYEFYAEIRWNPPPTTSSTGLNISITVIHPTGYLLDDETTKQLNKFCFPIGKPTFSSPERFCFVLTDKDGLFRFGFCRYDTIRKCCMFLLSYLPWFDCFYSFLLMLQGYTSSSEKDEREHRRIIPNLLLERLYILSLPAPETTSISLSIVDESITLQQALTNPQDPLSMLPSLPIPSAYSLPKLSDCQNIQLLYSKLDPTTIISVFSSLLQERRIIVHSKSLTDLTAVVHGLSQLIYPMFWQHIFIPVIPEGLTDYCCAPMPFLCGVPEVLMSRVRQLPIEDVVILNIDESSLETPFQDQSIIPKELLQNLSNVIKKPINRTDTTIPEAFLHFFAMLLGGYRGGMKQYEDKIVFDQDLFKESQPPYLHGILDQLFQLQMFDQFIASRTLYLKNYMDDPFEQECRKYKGHSHKSTQQKFSDFGDKIADAKDNFVTKFKDLEIIRSDDLKTSTNEMFKQAETGMKSLRCFLNKQIAKSAVKLKTKSQIELTTDQSLTNSISTVDFNEIERQYCTMEKRQSTILQKSRVISIADVKRPDRPPPPIPPPYSQHKIISNQFLAEKPQKYESLTPPLPQKISLSKTRSFTNNEINLISFDGPAQSNIYSNPKPPPTPPPRPPQQAVPSPMLRRLTNPYSTTSQQNNVTTQPNLLIIPPVVTETNLDDFLNPH
ncbi:DENN domain-containing protein 1A [Oopsacas minuta]|uniref:DENN domain-containing protein 1A n=1 Tax=Oopsacas minuta TaxID=111878 RepID=A0AAV7JKX8_9METZ|nr:DENN domain-containing protein 1A [Oopsacas minuta]